MNTRRILEWIVLVATAVLLMVLKELHIGVTHYNIFLLILLGWTLAVIVIFRGLSGWSRSGESG